MSVFSMYILCPVLICLCIMSVSADIQRRKVNKAESAWFRLHGKKVLWVVGFFVDMLLIYLLLLAHEVYEENFFSISNNTEEVTDSIQTDSLLLSDNTGRFITHVTLTTYNPVKGQCDDTPLITADGTKIDLDKLKKGEIKYCAVSPDLLWCLPFKTRLYIEGHGVYEVRDTMNKRFDHCIDILQHTDKKNFKKTKIKVIRLD